MFGRAGADMEFAGPVLHQAHGGEEREHDVRGALLKPATGADPGEVRGVFGQPREEIEPGNGGREQVHAVEAIALTIDERRVGGRHASQVESRHAGSESDLDK